MREEIRYILQLCGKVNALRNLCVLSQLFDQADIEKTPPFFVKRWSFLRCGRLPVYPVGK
ncbi:hypothetical protein BACCAP_04099 [Pseudoflavonifractor capillosus ATCC 29799]|uniref:Uncharacterized protein n=1 Tax=Pseudoflavonifractor capillosus ATCC 29799 TaxID=411467 RepID=A6P0T3_9FIRM|nr:hypothetical protein BACCAP_04099 [Pseudoflavonifractor capillosus ATCC 29799]